MNYHVILNPAAGRGLVRKVEPELLKIIDAQLGKVHLYRTESPGHAREIAGKLKNEGGVVIAVGGDGTIHEVTNGLVGGNCILGIVPVGSGNDFVKMLNLPLKHEEALEVIKRQNTMAIDIGKAGESYFANGLGMGFDAEAVIETQKVKRLRGFLIYLYSVFKALIHYKNRTVMLSIDGKKETREVFMITIGNGECMGGGFYLTPGAKIDDGILDICIFQGLTRGEVLRHLPKALKGKHVGLSQVQCLRAKHLIVESTEGIPVHADGELLGAGIKRLEISILPGALNVIHNL